jgi:hypothetical protein
VNELEARIASLPDAEVLEAINMLAGAIPQLGATPEGELLQELAGAVSSPPGELRSALAEATPAQVAASGRLVLMLYAASDPDLVEEAVAETGQRAMLLEIVGVGMLALALLHLLKTGGRKRIVEETTVKIDKSGKTTVTTRRDVTNFSLGELLAPIVRTLLHGDEPGGQS